MTKPNKINMKRDFFIIILIIFALAGIAGLLFWAPESSNRAYGPVDVGGGELQVDEQDNLDQVGLTATLVAPGWVTIHRAMGSAPAQIIGTSEYLPVGGYLELTIDLDEPMLFGYQYIALLHVDDGDQEFDSHYDLPVETNGQVVRADFRAASADGSVE